MYGSILNVNPRQQLVMQIRAINKYNLTVGLNRKKQGRWNVNYELFVKEAEKEEQAFLQLDLYFDGTRGQKRNRSCRRRRRSTLIKDEILKRS